MEVSDNDNMHPEAMRGSVYTESAVYSIIDTN